MLGLPQWLSVEKSACSVGDASDMGLIPEFGTPLQYSCWENPMDRGAWWATVHEAGKSQT